MLNSFFKVQLFWSQADEFNHPQIVILILQWALNFWKDDDVQILKNFERENPSAWLKSK